MRDGFAPRGARSAIAARKLATECARRSTRAEPDTDGRPRPPPRAGRMRQKACAACAARGRLPSLASSLAPSLASSPASSLASSLPPSIAIRLRPAQRADTRQRGPLHFTSPGLAPSHAIARNRTARRAVARRSSARPPSAHSRPPAGERNRRITRARTRPASPAAASRNDRAASSLRIRCEKARAVAGSARRRRRNPAARPAARRASG